MQYLLQWQLTNPCLLPDVIIEADKRDSELEGTSCASTKLLSAVVNSLRAYSRSSRPSLVPNRKSPEELTSTTTARTFLGLDVLDQGQAPWSQRLSQFQLLKVLSWREKPFLSLLFLSRFCTSSLNVDSILSYTQVASDFQSETLTVFSVNSKNNMNKLATRWTFVSASWLLLTNHLLL